MTAIERPRVTEHDLGDLAEWGITSVEQAEAILDEAAAMRRGDVKTYTYEEIEAEFGLDD